jgi:hypothetical protein
MSTCDLDAMAELTDGTFVSRAAQTKRITAHFHASKTIFIFLPPVPYCLSVDVAGPLLRCVLAAL